MAWKETNKKKKKKKVTSENSWLMHHKYGWETVIGLYN